MTATQRPLGCAFLLLLAAPLFASSGAPRAQTPPAVASVDVRRLDAIEPLVAEAIDKKNLPGAVVVVGRGDKVVYQKAMGNRALVPRVEPMTLDTIFDLASL